MFSRFGSGSFLPSISMNSFVFPILDFVLDVEHDGGEFVSLFDLHGGLLPV